MQILETTLHCALHGAYFEPCPKQKITQISLEKIEKLISTLPLLSSTNMEGFLDIELDCDQREAIGLHLRVLARKIIHLIYISNIGFENNCLVVATTLST